MRQILTAAYEFCYSRPIFAGATATVTGWASAFSAWIDTSHKAISLLGAVFGTIAAFFGMLIAARSWDRNRDIKSKISKIPWLKR